MDLWGRAIATTKVVKSCFAAGPWLTDCIGVDFERGYWAVKWQMLVRALVDLEAVIVRCLVDLVTVENWLMAITAV